MGSRANKGLGLFFTVVIVLICLTLVFFRGYWWRSLADGPMGEYFGKQAVIDNYGDAFKKLGKEFKIAPEYLAALCMLESGGRKPAGSRYEKHVYARLRLVKMGLKRQYEHVKTTDLETAEDEALQNLATSWGPFQLMGYKCLLYDIKIKDLREENGTYWGVKWIDEAYGKFLRKGDYKNAFHIHNTGRTFPASGISKTHDPNYVKKGLELM
ncbi:MAG: hypothetical protein ACKO6I_08695, partial [Sphingomonadales bacterium]